MAVFPPIPAPLSDATAQTRGAMSVADQNLSGSKHVDGNLTATGMMICSGGLGVGNSSATSSVGVRKMQVFDQNGNPLGYIAIYSSIP